MNKLQLQTPLHMCVRYKEFEILKVLVPLRPQPNLKDKEGNTPLHVGACIAFSACDLMGSARADLQ